MCYHSKMLNSIGDDLSDYKDYSCEDCRTKDKKLQEMKGFMEELIEHLYGKQKFNREHVDYLVGTLADFFDIKLDHSSLAVEQSNESVRQLAMIMKGGL